MSSPTRDLSEAPGAEGILDRLRDSGVHNANACNCWSGPAAAGAVVVLCRQLRARDSVYGRARSTSTRETGDTWHVMWTGHTRWPPAQVQLRNRAPRVQDENFFALACLVPVVTAKWLCPDHTSRSAAALKESPITQRRS